MLDAGGRTRQKKIRPPRKGFGRFLAWQVTDDQSPGLNLKAKQNHARLFRSKKKLKLIS